MSSMTDEEISMADAPKPGVWLVASFCTSCDQTIASLIELARFYPRELPPETVALLRETFPRNRRHNGEPIESLAALFEPASDAALTHSRPGCPYLSQLIETREKTSAADYLGWALHRPEPNPGQAPLAQWGAFELFVMDYEFLPPPEIEGNEPDYITVERQGEGDAFMAAGLAHCRATLDAMQNALGLGAPELFSFDGQLVSAEPNALPKGRPTERARWGEDWIPACLQNEPLAAAEAELERFAIDSAALKSQAAAPRPPRV